ncbi:MAG: NYN domain-containing protein [Firmicutes bacterium]|nr:NYN domain-containing protein [Bacillota bacterium]
MDEYLLVDGYNIIFAWEKLKKISEHSLEDARDKLIHILSDYQGYRRINLIIVFDAHHVKGNPGSIVDYGNLFVVYTKEAETADSYIERTSSELNKHKYSVRVATSDGMEQIIIMGNGAIRVSARELELDVKAAKKSVRKRIEDIKPIKNNTLMSNVDKETAEWLEKMRRSK